MAKGDASPSVPGKRSRGGEDMNHIDHIRRPQSPLIDSLLSKCIDDAVYAIGHGIQLEEDGLMKEECWPPAPHTVLLCKYASDFFAAVAIDEAEVECAKKVHKNMNRQTQNIKSRKGIWIRYLGYGTDPALNAGTDSSLIEQRSYSYVSQGKVWLFGSGIVEKMLREPSHISSMKKQDLGRKLGFEEARLLLNGNHLSRSLFLQYWSLNQKGKNNNVDFFIHNFLETHVEGQGRDVDKFFRGIDNIHLMAKTIRTEMKSLAVENNRLSIENERFRRKAEAISVKGAKLTDVLNVVPLNKKELETSVTALMRELET